MRPAEAEREGSCFQNECRQLRGTVKEQDRARADKLLPGTKAPGDGRAGYPRCAGGLKIDLGWRPKKAKPAVAPAPYRPQRAEPKKEEPKKEYQPAKQEPAEQPIYQGADVDIFFDLNKSVIRDDQVNTLNRLVSFMRNTPDAKVKLDGYADKQTGNAEINQELSELRVIAVRQYLVSRGIDQSRISTAAHGDRVQPFTGEKNRAVTCRIR